MTEARDALELELRRALESERQRGIDLTIALRQLEEAQRIVEQAARLTEEMKIAAHLQTSILPTVLDIPGLEIAARMRPADQVGGDYYDVQPIAGACWIGIGDVAGHGLSAGVIMLMIQSIAAGLMQAAPSATPAALLTHLNNVLYENVRNRLRRRDHATVSLLRIDANGAVRAAGAHQDVLVLRAGADRCECIQTQGTWVGITPVLAGHTPEVHFALAAGDLMVLYTDGITEAMDEHERHFGMERLCDAVVGAARRGDAGTVVTEVFAAVDAFAPWPTDDATVLVVKKTA
jgi:serine phosphatase RsbU (regulator of sigma subunit)